MQASDLSDLPFYCNFVNLKAYKPFEMKLYFVENYLI